MLQYTHHICVLSTANHYEDSTVSINKKKLEIYLLTLSGIHICAVLHHIAH